MKSTKRSLWMSVLSLVLCFTMLLGTTWAWFTDEVTSGVNQIIAGNLDVELYHATGGAVTAEDANKVTSTTKLFNIDLWEPGMVAYENFMVKNVGNLALKYQLAMTVGDFNKTADGNHTLKEVLKVAVVPGGFTGTTRAEAEALTGYTRLDEFSVSSEKSLLPGSTGDTFGVVIYWQPTDNDNLYNLNNGKTAVASNKFGTTELGIELGVKLLASQLEHEYDSFGNDYDGEASYSETVAATIEAGKDTVFYSAVTPSNVSGNTTKVTVPKEVKEFLDASGQTSSMTVVATPTVAANNKFTVSTNDGAVGAIDLTVKVNDQVVSQFKDANGAAIPVTVETYIAKNMTNVSLSYNNGAEKWEQVANENGVTTGKFFYDKATGRMVYGTTHFSTFVLGADEVAYVEENNTAYLTLEEAAEYADGKSVTVELLKNIDFSDKYAKGAFRRFIFENDVVDLNGYSISNRNASIDFDGDNMLIKNGKFIGTNGASYGLFIGDGIYGDRISTGIVVEDIEFVGGLNIFAAEVTIREMVSKTTANAESYYAIWGDEAAVITVESGTFKSESTKGGCVIHAYDGSNPVAPTPANVVIKGGNYIALNEKVEMCGEGIDFIQIQGGTFNRDPSDNVAEGYTAIDNKDGTWTVKPAN